VENTPTQAYGKMLILARFARAGGLSRTHAENRPDAETSLDEPLLTHQQSQIVRECSRSFQSELPARSVNVLRIHAHSQETKQK